MKIIAFLTLILSFSVFAQSKITKITFDDKGRTIRLEPGFADSSFYYKTAQDLNKVGFCYTGGAEGVCSIIEDIAAEMERDYLGGAHDQMIVYSCVVEDRSVIAKYNLLDDYNGDLVVERKIQSCVTTFIND